MTENIRRKSTPEEYIRLLFKETADGKLPITYYPPFEESYTETYDMDWTADDAEALVTRYTDLTAALTRIGNVHDKLTDEEQCRSLLSAEDLDVWNTYIRPYPAFNVDPDLMAELFERHECDDDMTDEEIDILERHYEWLVENALTRLPFNRCHPYNLIQYARRYAYLIHMNAPTNVLNENGRFLAEEMVRYYHLVNKYDLARFLDAQNGVYPHAFKEIAKGKKRTHWMWFIFPQLRGLGSSELSYKYGIDGLEEAKAYFRDPLLRPRLERITDELLKLNETDPEVIFGDIDAQKLQSCMTLFAYICGDHSLFGEVLDKFYGSKKCAHTLAMLA